MKWASILLGILTLPLLFNFTPLEVMRLKTFDYFIETPELSGNFVILVLQKKMFKKEEVIPSLEMT